MTDLVTAEHLGLDFDCRTECFLEETNALKRIIAAAVGADGTTETVCTLCLPDRITSPGFYDTSVGGTHLLSEDILAIVVPDEFPEFDRELQPQLVHDCREVCIAEDPTRFLVAFTVAPAGEVATVCSGCVLDLLEHPGKYDGLDIHGTHILGDEIIRHLFPKDFEDA